METLQSSLHTRHVRTAGMTWQLADKNFWKKVLRPDVICQQ